MSTVWWFIVAIGLLVVGAAFENEMGDIKGKLNRLALSHDDLENKLKMIEHNMASALKALPREQETIEEQWLRENYHPPA